MCGKAVTPQADEKGLLRLFVAIDMPESVKQEIHRMQSILMEDDLFVGPFVNYDTAHLTLQFIGYVDHAGLAPVKKLLRSVSFKTINAKLGRVGYFDSNGSIKVIWLEVIGDGIAALAEDIEKVLSFGVPSEKKEFVSHVTLARVKSVEKPVLLKEKISEIKAEPISFTISEFVLKRSIMGRGGSIYMDLEKYPAAN